MEISVFDVVGRRLATIENAQLPKGAYARTWNMSGVSSGMYFVRLRMGAATLTKTLLKLQ
mgnify:CR=1 FL=1